jgi:hypothetical protein
VLLEAEIVFSVAKDERVHRIRDNTRTHKGSQNPSLSLEVEHSYS